MIVRHPLLVIATWLALALILFLTIPPLPVVALKKPPAFLPSDSPVLVSTSQMKDAFHEPSSGNLAVVILSNEKGLTPPTRASIERWWTRCARTPITC
jgi:RND superfamily putative drug exporter